MTRAARQLRPGRLGVAVAGAVALAAYIWAGGVFDLVGGVVVAAVIGILAGTGVWLLVGRVVALRQKTASPAPPDRPGFGKADDNRAVRPALLAAATGLAGAVVSVIYLGTDAQTLSYAKAALFCAAAMALAFWIGARVNEKQV